MLMIVQIALYWIGGLQIINGNLTIGMFTILSSYFNNIVTSIGYFSNLYQDYLSTLVSYKRVDEIFNIENDSYGNDVIKEINRITFVDVSFYYNNDKMIFKDLNLVFNKGELNIIIGKNGTGKSTLINLMLGLYSNYKGMIKFNNKNIKELDLYKTRENCFGLVDQKPLLISDSIYKNLCLNENYDRNIVLELTKTFNLFNENSTEILSENINEMFSNVSGGEGQKINLIREILRNKDVIIFDEPTASLDIESKNIFLKMIENLKKTHLIIIITHDKKLITLADTIVDLSKE